MADKTPKAQVTTGAGRWTKVVLVLSLALNLFVIAVVVGASFGHHRWRPSHGGVHDVGVGLFTEVLTRQDRLALRDAFLAAAPDFRDERRVAQEDFAELAKALRQDPWDPARVEGLMARHGKRLTDRLDLGGRLLSERFRQMTASERAALADRIDDRLQHGWRR
jgi:uncharacterized membrane protein